MREKIMAKEKIIPVLRQGGCFGAGSGWCAQPRGMASTRRTPLALAALIVALAVLALTATPAFAERTYDSQITGLTNPWGVTVDPSDNVWISQPQNGGGLIDEYNPYPSQTKIGEQTGGGHYGPTYIRSLAVDSANGNLYVADSGPVNIDVFEHGTGAYVQEINHAFGGGYIYVAADNSGGISNGDIYAASTCCSVQKFDGRGNAVDFSSSASYIIGNRISGTPDGSFGEVWNVSTDNEGNIYVVDKGRKVIDEFDPSGEFVREFTGAGVPGGFSGNLTGVAVDPTNGSVFVVDSGNDVVDEFESSGAYLGQLTGTSASTPFGSLQGGIAVNSEGYVYVPDGSNGVVDIFTPAAIQPKVIYEPVTNATQTSGVLNATVEPNGGGNIIACNFEYGATNSYGHSLPCLDSGGAEIGTPLNPIESELPTKVHAGISGLSAETTYHYRLVAGNSNAHGTKRARDQDFTPHAVAGVCTEPSTSIERNAATLHGCFIGNGEDTKYYFEWGTTEGYGHKTAAQDAGSPTAGEGLKSFSFNLNGLQVATQYHYRFAAENAVGTTLGQDQSFETPVAVAGVSTSLATNISATTATLNGSWIGNGEDTHYYFEWGPTSSYGNVTTVSPGADGGSGADVQSVAFLVTGLEALSIYHYRIVASNSTGTTVGSDQSFETIGVPIYSYAATPSTTQAGGHPDIVTSFSFATQFTIPFEGSTKGTEDAKNITNQLPTGVVGNPHAVPQCTRVEFNTHACPVSAQVGWVSLAVNINHVYAPVFNMETGPDQAGLLAFYVPLLEAPQYLVFSARTGGDYGLNVTLVEIERSIPFNESTLTLWGVPAESSNDADRAPFGSPGCVEKYPCFEPNTSDSERTPFLDNPTSCGEPLSSSLELEAYNLGVTKASDSWPATTGCDQLSFNPSLHAQPTTKQADSPSGLDVDLSVPQLVSPTSPAPSEIRALSLTLPKGMSINPNAADGKRSCSDTEARFGTEEEAQCPESSKVGTATLDSSTLPAPIPGAVYIGEPEPGNRYRLFLTANGYSTHVKLAGSVEPNAQTGQLVVSFQNLPQSPFSEFNLHFFGSERGLLATPTQCGTYPVQSTFTPWDAVLPVQTSTQYFKIEEGPGGSSCPTSPRPFDPSFTAGVAESTAGAHTAFSLEFTRNDGDQELSALNVTTPPGFSATLKGIPYCSDGSLAAAAQPSYSGLREQSSPSCPAASQIGSAQAGAGAGDSPRLPPRQGLPGRPLQRRSAQPRGDHPGGLRPL